MGLFRRGSDDQPTQDEIIDQQARQSYHQTGLQAGLQDYPESDDSLLDVVETQLEAEEIENLKNLIVNDIPLANINPAEIHEFRWMVRAIEVAFNDMYPSEDGFFTGEYRAIIGEDPRDAMTALDTPSRLEIRQVIEVAIIRATRAKDGWQQEQWDTSKQISQLIEDQSNDADDGGWL